MTKWPFSQDECILSVWKDLNEFLFFAGNILNLRFDRRDNQEMKNKKKMSLLIPVKNIYISSSGQNKLKLFWATSAGHLCKRTLLLGRIRKVCKPLYFSEKQMCRECLRVYQKQRDSNSDSRFQSQTKLKGNKSSLRSDRRRKYKSNGLLCHVC